MTVHPIVRIASQITGAIGGYALTQAVIGTTVVVTTSWLMYILAFVIYLALLALGMYVGYAAATAAIDYVSEDSFEGYGASIGKGIASVRGLFSRKAA